MYLLESHLFDEANHFRIFTKDFYNKTIWRDVRMETRAIVIEEYGRRPIERKQSNFT